MSIFKMVLAVAALLASLFSSTSATQPAADTAVHVAQDDNSCCRKP
jgi:hypothetical protein